MASKEEPLKLVTILNNQRNCGQYCDIELNVDGKTLYAHSAILSSFSKYIRDRCIRTCEPTDSFNANKCKNYNNFSLNDPISVNITDLETANCFECVQSILDYIYLNKLLLNDAHLIHLNILSKFFGIDDLLNIFEIDPSETKKISSLINFNSNQCNTDINLAKPKVMSLIPRIIDKIDDLEVQNNSEPDALFIQLVSNNKSITKSQGKMHTCIHCNYQCYKPADLLSHLKTSIMCQKEKTCSLCWSRFNNSQELLQHLSLHDDPKPFFCTFCDLRFPSRTTLNQHVPKHSTETPYICPHCTKGFKWKHGLNSHLVVHSKEMKHLCDECGFSTAHAKTLRAHKLIHTGALLRCPHPGCSHSSQRKENLKIHVATHSKDTPFVCEICGHKFSQSKNLKRHARIHDPRISQHQCPHCYFKSPRSDKLKEHIARHHTEKRLHLELTEHVEGSFIEQGEVYVGGMLNDFADSFVSGIQEPDLTRQHKSSL